MPYKSRDGEFDEDLSVTAAVKYLNDFPSVGKMIPLDIEEFKNLVKVDYPDTYLQIDIDRVYNYLQSLHNIPEVQQRIKSRVTKDSDEQSFSESNSFSEFFYRSNNK